MNSNITTTSSIDIPFLTASFYLFVPLTQLNTHQEKLRTLCATQEVTGTILLAPEGINGTLCGEPERLRDLLNVLRHDEQFARLEHKESFSTHRSLTRLKIKIKPEIITMGQPDIDPANQAGEYVEPDQWNSLISDPDVVVIDTRNTYEVAIGQFDGAINPETENFSDLPDWLDKQIALKPETKVAMYCTGGIRCEKSTALLRARGFNHVYHLRGGILKYLETVALKESLWHGDCFVFDDRISVNHQLKPGAYEPCPGCGHPINAENKTSEKFVAGISCEFCFDK